MPCTPTAPGRAFLKITHDGQIGSRTRAKFDRIPCGWLEVAARLPGKSLHAGVALWYVAGLTRSACVPLSNIAGLRFGLDRNAKYRALAWLEDAGLIIVERKLGRAPIVTILEARPAP